MLILPLEEGGREARKLNNNSWYESTANKRRLWRGSSHLLYITVAMPRFFTCECRLYLNKSIDRRGLNDIYRARISCGRIIRLHAPPLPNLSHQQVCLSFSVFLCVAGPAYWWTKRGERRGRALSRIIRPQESLSLYKPFNTLWQRPSLALLAWARICKPFKEPRNRFPAWRAGTTTLFGVPAHQAT
jgi:hypothetical protein